MQTHLHDTQPIRTLSFSEIAQHIFQFKWLICSISSVFAVLSIVIALLLPVQYTAQLIFAPAAEEQNKSAMSLSAQFGSIANFAGINLGSNSDLETNLAILNSREFTYEFIEENQLMPILFSEQWDEQKQAWHTTPSPTLWDAYKKFHSQIRAVSEESGSQLITLYITWTDAEQSAIWANLLIEKLNSHIRAKDIQEAERSLTFLNTQIQSTNNVRMKELLYTLVEKQVQTVTLAKVRDEYAFTIIDKAVVPQEKSKPKRSLIVIAGTMLGGILALMLSLILPSRKAKQKL